MKSKINYNNQNKLIENFKSYYYYTQSKNIKKNISINLNKQLSEIKCTSYKDLFNIRENQKSGKVKKSFHKKLFLLNNKEEKTNNSIKLNFYNTIFDSLKNCKKNNITTKSKKLSESFKMNDNRIYSYLLKESYKQNIGDNRNNKQMKLKNNNSLNNLLKNNNILTTKMKNLFGNKFILKKSKDFYSTDKLYKNSNYRDASTNTTVFLYKNGYNSNKNKRPLMIDYMYHEHKKFYYGFDKLKGKNKNKKPYFIVHKY